MQNDPENSNLFRTNYEFHWNVEFKEQEIENKPELLHLNCLTKKSFNNNHCNLNLMSLKLNHWRNTSLHNIIMEIIDMNS